MEQKSKEELEAQGKKPTWRRYINFISTSISERINSEDKIFIEVVISYAYVPLGIII